MTWTQKSALLRDRYPMMAGPLVLVAGVAAASHAQTAPILAATAGSLLLGLTANRLGWRVAAARRRRARA